MESAAWLADDPIVGVVCGSDAIDSGSDVPERLHATLADRPCSIASGTIEDVLTADPSLLVAIGDPALTEVARRNPDSPVLPVGSVPGIETIDPDRLEAAISAVIDGGAIERHHPLLGINHSDGSGATDRYRALFDVTLVTTEPARISEYSVRSRGEEIDQFRADGVVVATPAGSYGYAGAVDAPQLSAAIDAVAVAPIAPFVTTTRRWVLPNDDLELSVERDEGSISLLADDRAVGTVSASDRVVVGVDGTLTTLSVPSSML